MKALPNSTPLQSTYQHSMQHTSKGMIFLLPLLASLTSFMIEGLTDADGTLGRPPDDLAKHWYRAMTYSQHVVYMHVKVHALF